MPGSWTGLRALAAASGYHEAFLEPEAAWNDEPVTDFTVTDLLWWRPVETNALRKDQVIFGFYMGSTYHMACNRCDTRWLAEPDSIPKCWFCGKFVHLSENFKNERRSLRKGTNA